MSNSIYVASALVVSVLATPTAGASMVTDSHGNVGYDTAAECDAAVNSGKAKFYGSYTRKSALLRSGEKRVQGMLLKDLGIPPQFAKSQGFQAQDYKLGACDIGSARKLGRNGVAKQLKGKYVPYSPEMPVNVYLDQSDQPVRASMKNCDNWFGANFPRPVSPASVAMQPSPEVVAKASPPPTPSAVVVPPQPEIIQAPVVPVAPLVPAPVQAAAEAAQGVFSSKEKLGAVGFAAIAAYLLTHGTTGTTGTTGTN